MRLLTKKEKYSFTFLNITQFLGALNDNIFKLLIIYFLIAVKGGAFASKILATAGMVFVIPFLLFSSASGVLADRISKRTIIVAMKIAEIAIMSISVISFHLRSEFISYSLLFLMATQSAIFGPSKFGIIPEIVPTKRVSKANGILASFTYLAIILGTFLASFITDITHKNFVLASFACVAISALGYFASIGIMKTEAKGSTKKINPIFFYEIYKTLALTTKRKHLLTILIGCAFFLFIGGFTQLNTIPFAMQSLNLTDVGGGYLFLSTAIGIAIGCFIAGKISKENAEIGLSCVSGFFISICFLLLALFAKSLIMSVIFLVLLGVFGGMYLIPLESFIQLRSPVKRRGQVIAAGNFMSFVGVLIAALYLMIISGEFKLSARSGFAYTGVICLIINIMLTRDLSDLFFPYLARFIKQFQPLSHKLEIPNARIFILKEKKWKNIIYLYGILPHIRFILIDYFYKTFPCISGFFNTLYIVSPKKSLKKLFHKTKKISKSKEPVCVITKNENLLTDEVKKDAYFISFSEKEVQKRYWKIIFYQTQIKITFEPFEKKPVLDNN